MPTKQQLPHDIYGLSGYGILWYEWLLMMGGIVLLGVVILVLWRWWRRKRTNAVSAAPVLSPFEYWQDRIRQLAIAAPFARPAQVDFYYELSLAIRSAVEAATDLRATDLTYKELRDEFKRRSYTLPIAEQELLTFLNKADYVKFADQDCTMEQSESDRKQALAWLQSLQAFHERRTIQEVMP